MVVSLADDVLLPVLVHVLPGAVPQPRRDGELVVRELAGTEHAFGNHDAALAVEEDHAAVGRPALVTEQVFGPLGSGQLRVRQEVDRALAGAAQLPLAGQAVGVAVAACKGVNC